MKLVEMKCKNCGAKLEVNTDSNEAYCQFCGTEFKIDDEAQHIKYDDMEQAGYEFEKGKIRARQEHKDSVSVQPDSLFKKVSKSKTFWLIMAWICFLPFMATYYIVKSNKFDKKKKIILIVVMWVAFIVIAAIGSIQSSVEKKNKIVRCYSQDIYDKLNDLIGIENIEGNFSDTYSCDRIDLKDKYYKKISIKMNGEELVSIELDNKCIYNIDETVDIYDPLTLRLKEKK